LTRCVFFFFYSFFPIFFYSFKFCQSCIQPACLCLPLTAFSNIVCLPRHSHETKQKKTKQTLRTLQSTGRPASFSCGARHGRFSRTQCLSARRPSRASLSPLAARTLSSQEQMRALSRSGTPGAVHGRFCASMLIRIATHTDAVFFSFFFFFFFFNYASMRLKSPCLNSSQGGCGPFYERHCRERAASNAAVNVQHGRHVQRQPLGRGGRHCRDRGGQQVCGTHFLNIITRLIFKKPYTPLAYDL
jgi:hypothetical protein